MQGVASWNSAKGAALRTLFLAPEGGGTDLVKVIPSPLRSQKDEFQRLRLWWGSRGQSPLAGSGRARPPLRHTGHGVSARPLLQGLIDVVDLRDRSRNHC